MSRKHHFRKRKSVEWTESELKELKQVSDPRGDWLVDELTKNEFLTLMRCYKSMALKKGDEEQAKYYGELLDRLGETHNPKPKDWKILPSLMKRIQKTSKGV